MLNKELKALRKIFFLSVAEAAEHIGYVSARTWQRWELGEYKIPDDVEKKINDLAERRLLMIEDCDEVMNEHDPESTVFDFDMTFEDYKTRHPESNIIDWRLSQSVAAYFLGEGIAKLK